MDSSLNLNTLANSLPNSNLANAEKDLLNNFKAAALSITTLYRSSRQTSKRAYTTGYVSACQDILLMIQQGVSAGGVDENAMTVGRIMDWVEARLDAVKAREEEEDEEEEREGGSSSGQHHKGKATAVVVKPKTQKEQVIVGLATPNSPPNRSAQQLPVQPPTPSPSSSRPASSGHHRKPRRESPPAALALPISASLPDTGPHLTITNTHRDNHAETIATGAKRRHAVMMMLDSSPSDLHSPASPQTSVQTSRRRTRSTRGGGFGGLLAASDAMEVEEDSGMERKRVARR
jgi:hypothetical protein